VEVSAAKKTGTRETGNGKVAKGKQAGVEERCK